MDEINDGFLATLMAKSNDNVRDILKSVSLDETLEVQRKTDLYAMFLLGSYSREGGGGAKILHALLRKGDQEQRTREVDF